MCRTGVANLWHWQPVCMACRRLGRGQVAPQQVRQNAEQQVGQGRHQNGTEEGAGLISGVPAKKISLY